MLKKVLDSFYHIVDVGSALLIYPSMEKNIQHDHFFCRTEET